MLNGKPKIPKDDQSRNTSRNFKPYINKWANADHDKYVHVIRIWIKLARKK
jgi:hypothetical protein